MNWYIDNTCRICKKVFCCTKCRGQHEVFIHKVFLNCNICLFGRTFLKDPTESLVEHIKKHHWPLHCVNCKNTFTTFDELSKQNKCFVEDKNQNLERSPYPSNQSPGENNYESPLYFSGESKAINNNGMFPNLATSTPLQRQEENNLPEKSNEVITPVDFSDINKDKQYFTDSASIKRKVTFCETPVTEVYEDQENLPPPENKFEDHVVVTPDSGNSPAVFYSAKQSIRENSTQDVKNEVKNINMDSAKIEEKQEIKNVEIELDSNTLWISAVNTSPADILQENKPLINIDYTTPMIAKLKKRQINVVLPIAVRKKDIALQSPLDLCLPTPTISKPGESVQEVHQQELHEFLENVDEVNETSSNMTDTQGVLTEACLNAPNRLWTSMSRIIKNVTSAVQEFSHSTCSTRTPLKRSMSEYDLLDGPCIKRYKLTEIKCRRPIRQSTILERLEEHYEDSGTDNKSTGVVKKILVNKATQTDEELTGLKFA